MIKTINIFILLLPVRQGSTLVMVFGTLIFRAQVLSKCLSLLTDPTWQSPAAGCFVLIVQKLKQAAATQKVCLFFPRFLFLVFEKVEEPVVGKCFPFLKLLLGRHL